ncbi:hypothetical protein M569_04760 [Genlisea aurea]|uniref:Pentacotripeptide-repeat region of PRORP domain-containing protein n=1 Tax=Genlisea aurea TaxID=192259 RepID=S8CYB3_9LAMI|nr:hypothetical protein M569_04760 [Genlisea aurea]
MSVAALQFATSAAPRSVPAAYCNRPTHHIFAVINSTRRNRPVSCSSPIHHSTPLFLPFLQTLDPNSDHGIAEEEEEEEDPLFRFFKTRVIIPDPNAESRISLQKNRRTSWHLSSQSQHLEEPNAADSPPPHPDIPTIPPEPEGIVAEIAKIARELPQNVTIGEALDSHDFSCRLREEDCVEVLRVLSESGTAMDCLYFFEWMGLREPSLVSPKAYSVLFPALGKAGKGDELLLLFDNLPAKKTSFRDVRVYNSALTGLFFCRRYDDAFKVFHQMEEEEEANNIQPDHVTASIMLTIMRKNGNTAREAWDFFQDMMNRKGVKWSVESVGALVKSFCDEGLKKAALIIQSELEKKGVPSNAVIYNTIIDSYIKSDDVEGAEGLFAEMKAKGISPTDFTYNILMDGYSRRMQPEIVEDLMREMEAAGLKPDVRSYTCLISAYGRKKSMSDVAADAFLRMKKAGIKPSSKSYTALIHAFAAGGWHEKARIAFESMSRDGVKPTVETYTALLDAIRRSGDAETLTEVWKKMTRDDGIEGNRATFDVVLDGLSKHGRYAEARDVVFEFGKRGFRPTVVTYNMLMNAYGRGGRESKLPELLKEMEGLGIEPDCVTYSTMIYAYLRVRDFRRAFYYHKMMVGSGAVPDSKSYEKMRKILEEKADVKNRKDRTAMLGIINSRCFGKGRRPRGKKDEFWKNKNKGTRIRK